MDVSLIEAIRRLEEIRERDSTPITTSFELSDIITLIEMGAKEPK